MHARLLQRRRACASGRTRCSTLALGGKVEGWTVDLDRLADAADLTAAVTREQLSGPRHPLPRPLAPFRRRRAAPAEGDPAERARAAFDLVILSVLLDAGAGPGWRYVDPVAARPSLAPKASPSPASACSRPARSTISPALDTETLARGFQVSEDNPLLGLEGRAALLRRLGAQVLARPDLFAERPPRRPLRHARRAARKTAACPPRRSSKLLLEALGPIWADRLVIDGVPLGDCWRHPALRRDDASDGLVPLHKLSQWLAYSLIEPLAGRRASK